MSDRPVAVSTGSPLGTPGNEQATALAVKGMFAKVAPRYDLLNHLLSLRRDVAWRHATAKALRPVLKRPESIAVDLCCGTGDLAFALRRESAGSVIGTDFCLPMLEIAQLKARENSGRVAFFSGDAMTLPFADNSLDALSIGFGFRNLASYQKGLEEMLRVLRPGGWLAILECSKMRWPLMRTLYRAYFRHIMPRIGSWLSGVQGAYEYLNESVERFPDQEALAAAMNKAGFREVSYRNFMGGAVALHLGLKR